jgi:hypothetical protein
VLCSSQGHLRTITHDLDHHVLAGVENTDNITIDVIDMLYPYNAIFGRGLLNTFEAALHSGYLSLRIPATFRVISISESQEDARNIEQGFTPGQKSMHFL